VTDKNKKTTNSSDLTELPKMVFGVMGSAGGELE
jgi:hypothetical protein